MSLNQNMKTSFFEMQLQHLKQRKKGPLGETAALSGDLPSLELWFYESVPVGRC